MKIAIYNPYLDTAGGGEKYILTIAECLSQENEVDVILDKHLAEIGQEHIKSRIKIFHRLDLSRVRFIEGPLGKGSWDFTHLLFLRQYDWLFYLTDGSIFFSTAKNSIVHFQVPFENINAKGLFGRLKLLSWKEAIFNSEFTRGYVLRSWPLKGRVIYPPVSLEFFKPLKKQNQIISVGRFFGYTKSKKHEVMIDAFKRIVIEKGIKDWSLHLVGGVTKGDQHYMDSLKTLAEGFDIYFYPDADLKTLAIIYGESKIYWHAAGFYETDPKNMEHFGITTVEAMVAGCVPVVVGKGGLAEIVDDGVNGFLWNEVDQLIEITYNLINDFEELQNLSRNAIEKSKDFSKDEFVKAIKDLVHG